jgi:glycosyltransferase involved in cell wall biosynthesis
MPKNAVYHVAHHLLPPHFILTLKPVIVSVHDVMPLALGCNDLVYNPMEIKGRLAYLLMKINIKFSVYADIIICASNHTMQDLLHFFNVSKAKVKVIYYGLDHKTFRPRNKKLIRRRLGLPLNRPIVLNVGSELQRKNVKTLIKAFSTLLKDIPDALLIRIGDKSRYIQSLLASLNLKNKVLYFKVNPREVAYFYNAADVFVFPSYYEGFGLPPLEAMGSGCPVIASNRTSIPEVIGNAGILLEPFDIEGFSYWMREILTDENFKVKLSKKGYKRSLNFSWEKAAKETLEVYKKVINNQ